MDNNSSNILELLLSMKPKGLPEKDYKHLRLSKELGEDVIFRLRAMPYNRVMEIRDTPKDVSLHIVLEGVVSPDLKAETLREKFGGTTPLDLLKNSDFLLPGEVEELSLEISKLSGYVDNTLEEVKKN